MLESPPRPPVPPTREELEDLVLAMAGFMGFFSSQSPVTHSSGAMASLYVIAHRVRASREGLQDAHSAKSGRSTESRVVVEPSEPSRPVLPRRVCTRLTLEETADALRRLKAGGGLDDCEVVEPGVILVEAVDGYHDRAGHTGLVETCSFAMCLENRRTIAWLLKRLK